MKLLDKIIKEEEDYNCKVTALCKELKENFFDETFKEAFEKYPEVETISWTQYSPYFNDGEACIFEVHEISEINEEDTYTYDKAVVSTFSEIQESIPEEYLERIFGDGYQVTVHSNGTIDVEEYYHD